MTALAGFLDHRGRPDSADRSAAMLAAQARYAPAGAIQWQGDGIALGRRLFPTLPEDAFDTGPIREGSLVLVADLRLDNRAELIADLAIPSERAKSLCDAAILMRAFLKWRDEAVGRLIGDFAIALWDEERRRLLLARDFMGQRPLHYHNGNGFFAFASMPSGLHALSEIPRRPDLSSVIRFLERASPDGSLFEAVERVEPGHILTVTREGVVSRRYWNPSRSGPTFRDAAEAQEGFRERLDEAVAARLRGAGDRLGAHLSGGLDSGAVATAAARLLASPKGEILAFTAVPGATAHATAGRIDNEGPLAAATAAPYANITHIPIITPRASPLDFLDRDLHLNEQIVTNICNNVWIGAINDAARERGLKVLLTGSMGNLSFSYSGQEALSHLFVRGHWIRLVRLAAELRRGKRGWPGLAKQTLEPFLPRSNRPTPGLTQASVSRLVRTEAAKAVRPSADAFAVRVRALQRVDSGNFSKGALAGWGLDIRDPTADRRLVEFALALPVEQFLAGGTARGLARHGLAERLPPVVLGEHRRGYQGAGWHEALTEQRGQLLDEVTAIGRCPEAAAILDMPRIHALTAHWPKSWDDPAVESLYRVRLLPAIAAGHFIRATV